MSILWVLQYERSAATDKWQKSLFATSGAQLTHDRTRPFQLAPMGGTLTARNRRRPLPGVLGLADLLRCVAAIRVSA
jgi:hypothetical protein